LKKYSYSDGDDIENFLLNLFKNNPTKKELSDVLKDNNSWPVKYHLSKDRENLINWFEFQKNTSLLEIGAGCGAVTGAFLNKNIDVTAVELTERRSEIIKARFKNNKNLTVLSGNINDQKLRSKYDYATLIGVLEYAGRFIDSD